MNNDAPETLAAVRSRAAELEQQLKLSDEGVSRLAQRCLELEQQVLAYEAALASHGAENETGALLLPQLFYDSGSGFSARECLTVASDAYDELTHEVSAVFELPADVQALRLDPGEFACCITDFTISDERLSYQPANGTVLPDFPDRGQIATWAGEAVSWAYSRGVMTGKTGGKLDPNGNASRAEAAVMLYRFMKLSPKGDKR